MAFAAVTNYIVYRRIDQERTRQFNDLSYVGHALSGSPADALDEVARREKLSPGKYVVTSCDYLTIATGSLPG